MESAPELLRIPKIFVKTCYLGGVSEAEKTQSEKVVLKELRDTQKQYNAVREQQKQRDSEPSL